jgi:hypothetical protein
LLLLSWLVVLIVPPDARAEGSPESGLATLPQVAAMAPVPAAPEPRASSLAPGPAEDRAVAALWHDSTLRERERDFLGAAFMAELAVGLAPRDVHAHWRIARDYIQAVDALPGDDTSGRLDATERARDWARRGRALDPSCGECCFYEFAATARMASLVGPVSAVRTIRRAHEVLEQCFETPPTWVENAWSQERANLYHGASVFYRLLPDSRWFGMIAGVRGDRELAVELSRRAVATAPQRTDYAVELGAALLCYGTESGDSDAIAEGRRELARAVTLPDLLPSDASDRERAERLRADPQHACHDTRDGPIHLE